MGCFAQKTSVNLKWVDLLENKLKFKMSCFLKKQTKFKIKG